ncbi:MAG: toll/interleukin-1 receptor domain-containing protein [Chloroflexi bacterium CFX1]|nr:toll/interleukin-1 receptor domain-containing protein [Chloroflexi bacterium CFX1]MCQ3951992.1 hypothetical protein [Chloroflexota bacterium]MDL1919258.1 toll/interleukin-1 receptor domain-containing protein [Chloroflexi bacterium CFX5]NUQ59579.1 toll/interleukin-1 receptor domain-containing protein [Anaerolineales bacterium]
MTIRRPLKIFLSYASEDRGKASELHSHLLSLGAAPWLDVENLLPGQDWKMEIAKALDEADLVLLCLSNHSISREGYVQKEMRLALDRALEIPPGEIFLIPARFEPVELPYSLRDYQAVDLFAEDGMKRLVMSLNLRAKRIKARPLDIAGAPLPDMKADTPAPRKKTSPAPPASKVEIHIHGDVKNSNLIVGDGNDVNDTSKE